MTFIFFNMTCSPISRLTYSDAYPTSSFGHLSDSSNSICANCIIIFNNYIWYIYIIYNYFRSMTMSLVQAIFISLVHACMHAKSLSLCPTLCDPMDCSPPNFSVHGILQAGMLEWIAMPSSRGSSQSKDQTYVSYVSCIGRWALYH